MARVDLVYKPQVIFTEGTAVSSPTDIRKIPVRGLSLLVPTGWTTADIGFQVSTDIDNVIADIDAASWVTLYDAEGVGVKVSGIITNAAALYATPPELWALGNFYWMRLVSRSTATFANSVNQLVADKTITLGTLD